MWIIGGSNPSPHKDVWYSTNGVNWTQATAEAAFSARKSHTCVGMDNKLWVIAGSATKDVWYSSDGISWIQATASAEFDIRQYHSSFVFDNKMWVIGGMNDSSEYFDDVWYSE